MKLTKQLEKEVRQVYEAYWDSLLSVNMKAFNSFLDDNFKQIGTTEAEVFFNKKDAAKSLKATKDQIVGNIELRNRIIKVDPLDKFILITEESDAYVKIDAEWTFYSKTRISSLLQKKGNGWKFFQQHVSFPDSKTEKGETIALQQIKMENLQLRDAVKRRTVELENKNRELEIEASLEKVRAVAMGMKNPEDMLDVCRVISEQLQQFGVEHIRNVQTAIIDEQIGQYLCYQFFTPYDNTVVENTEYLKSPVEHEMVKQMLASRDGHFIGSITGKDLKEFRIHRKEENHFHDPLLDKASELSYCFLSIGEGGLGLSLYQPIDDGVLTLFKRFHQVFSLAYQRFRDIQKAEEQTREARIEAALERVRSRAMAMHKSEELTEAGELLYKELSKLGIENLTTGYVLFNDNATIGYSHGVNPMTGSIRHLPVGMPHNETWVMKSIVASWKKQEPLLVLELDPDETIAHQTFIAERSSNFPISAEQLLSLSPERLKIHVFNFSQGYLLIVGGTLLTEVQQEMVIRFAKVFEQTYTRFLDLQKAEAQAREAQIEAALERVRSRSLAMHSSDEFVDASDVMVNQLKELGIDTLRIGIGIINKKDDSTEIWSKSEIKGKVKNTILGVVPRGLHPIFDNTVDAWKSNIPFYSSERVGDEVKEYYQKMDSFLWYPERKEFNERETMTAFFFKHGSLNVISLDPLKEEDCNIMIRFAKVFGQIFQRFQDLQKAEAQAREAQIEAALERVRSRTMAMQSSIELGNVAAELFAQMNQLVTNLWTCGFVLCEKNRDEDEWWLSMDGDFTRGFFLPNIDDYAHATLYEGWLKGEALRAVQLDGEALQQHYDWLMDIPVSRAIFEEMDAAGLARPDWQKLHAAYFSKGYLVLITREPCGEEEIFKRFAQVFDQTYTRFLDLQKAEAQAREAQVNLAVERVRARALAMFKSEEILQVVNKLKEEIMGLDIPNVAAATIHLKEPDGTCRVWDLTSLEIEDEGLHLPLDIRFRLEDTHPDFFMRRVWENEADYFVVVQEESDFKHTIQWLRDNDQSEHADEAEEFFRTTQIKKVYHPTVPLNNGRMCIDLLDTPAPEVESILKKMAGAFDLAYKRFEDLQKAEEQTREAQIELSLERIRSQVTAMQESSDLLDIVVTMRTEFVSLGHEAHYFWHMRWLPDRYEKAMTSGDGTRIGMVMTLPRHIHGDIPPVADWEKSDASTHVLAMDVETAVEYVEKMITLGDFEQVDPQAPTLDDIRHIGGLTFVMARTTHGEIGFSLPGTVPDPPIDSVETLARFAGVFDLAYKRFEDLKAAERQHREAQIELALERVRARSMAMHKSDELSDLSLELVKQVHALGVATWFCAFNIYDDDPKGSLEWGSNGQGTFPQYRTPREGIFLRYYEAGQRGETLLVNEIGEKECPAHYDYLCSLPGVGEQLLKIKDAGIPFPTSQIDHVAYFKYGYILFITFEPAHEAHDIFKRFARVFEQTYTRFLDLQKAEAQSREAQIEAALEKVRSRSLAMHKSDELNEVVSILFEKLKELQIPATAVGIGVPIDGSKDLNSFVCGENKDGLVITNYRLPYFDNEIPKDLNKAIERQLEYFVGHYSKEEKDSFYEYVIEHTAEFRHLPEDIKRMIFDSPTYTISMVAVKNALFNINDFEGKVLGENDVDVVKRFARVFDQAYTRFQDLQKAEAQTREAKIETALEKVRSRTMGMQSSEELPEVANLLFLEVQALGIPAWSCGYNILSEDKKSSTCIMSSEGELQIPFTLPLTEHVSLQPWHQAIINDEEFFVYAQGGEDLAAHYMYMKSLPELRSVFQQFEDADISLPTYQVNHLARFTHGFLLFITYEPVPGAHDIFKRFTHVFEQTYTRFLDLKKAETQAREAQIENALEKVRSRSLSMQKPDELIEVAQLLREEMGALGVEELETSSIYIHDESSETTQCWFTIKNTDDPDRAVTDQMTIDLQDTWVGRKMYAFYRSSDKQASILMQGANRTEWIRYCEEKSSLFSSGDFYGETIPERTYHLYKFSNGYIGAAAPGEISQESWDLLKRATAVFSFAYTRFRDLQNAEASARTSLRQASLDRVRADISSMRNSEDLDRITPLMFNELTTLGIPFIRCGVFIVHEKSKTVEVYLSTPEGKSLAAMNLSFDANSLTARSVDAWKKEEVYVEHWNQADFINWGKSLAEQGHIKDLKTYQGAEAPPQSLHLYFIPFTQGLLYVGSTGTLDAEQIDLVKALARAFDIAYARYEDFVRLEHAKVEVESAMSELKSTQSQLVQQEKLASLGQLTAGIAHEIKNPLNFVNNFSEVSLELIDEAIEEIQKIQKNGHATEAADLLSDIKSNLSKIHEHGTRANGIVTSMLQHSRGGSGEMEPTDLNALIKEYVHLCFHGMRASKNPINVDIQLNLDPPVGMVSLIKEDFARVIINLCNNAFDAMRSKLSYPSQQNGYTPKLAIRTRRNANHVLIEIADNGPGIPDDIKDKILQPFFTTKKGTQGTGLGLSITNDIVKAHGGVLDIISKDGSGAAFRITLPASHK